MERGIAEGGGGEEEAANDDGTARLLASRLPQSIVAAAAIQRKPGCGRSPGIARKEART